MQVSFLVQYVYVRFTAQTFIESWKTQNSKNRHDVTISSCSKYSKKQNQKKKNETLNKIRDSIIFHLPNSL